MHCIHLCVLCVDHFACSTPTPRHAIAEDKDRVAKETVVAHPPSMLKKTFFDSSSTDDKGRVRVHDARWVGGWYAMYMCNVMYVCVSIMYNVMFAYVPIIPLVGNVLISTQRL